MVPFRCQAWPTPSVIETVLVKLLLQDTPCLGLDLSPFVDLEKQGLDQPFYSHTYHWNSGMVAVVAGHSLVR
ncbi:hypothetical protein OUZ56_002566 [Daphnia magna]|uniref:Uncharacterized protein n=1 Tax=Daphnia magna TaxID=35525 RepID=A0ABR0A629_9CRUS|nr:hypothetical protein OUZ56_002566 [Daphnia magna]